jgi:hypothetical protein
VYITGDQYIGEQAKSWLNRNSRIQQFKDGLAVFRELAMDTLPVEMFKHIYSFF